MANPTLLRKMLFFALIFIISSIASLLLFEIMLRISGKGHAQDVHTASQEVIDHIPGMFEPDQTLMKLSIPQLPHRISINSLGYRGPEVRLNKLAWRILCIGDSFTFGDYVDDNGTFPYDFRRYLRRNLRNKWKSSMEV